MFIIKKPHTSKLLPMALAIAAVSSPAAVNAQALVLEEIVVTATKKDEMVQDVPSTVNVLTADRMKDLNVFSFEDIEALTPGLSLTKGTDRNKTIALRGISVDPESGAAAGVVVYTNGIPMRPDIAFQQMYDLSRVEILRGPQGTLQGETSPAGSIQLYTNRANVDVVEGEILQTFSDNSGSNTQLAASMPLIEGVLGIRVAGAYDDAETGVDTDDSVGRRTGTRDSRSGRFSISFLPTDDLDMHLTYQYLEANTDAYQSVIGSDQLTNNPTLEAADRTSLQEGKSTIFTRAEFANLEVNYLMGDHMLTWLTGYQETLAISDEDLDRGNGIPDYENTGIVRTNVRRVTQELRIANTESDFWEYTGGLFYQNTPTTTLADNRSEKFDDFGAGPVVAPPSFTNNLRGTLGFTQSVIPVGSEGFGAFLDNKFYLNESTTLGFGVRWSKNRRASTVDVFSGEGFTTVLGPVPEGVMLTQLAQSSKKSTAWTGGFKLTHDLNEEIMVYGAIDRSYRPGGFSITPDSALLTANDLSFDEETSNNIEVGFKSTLDNGRYQINGAVFYQDFKDYISRANTIWVDTTSNSLADTLIQGGLTYNSDAIVRGAEVEFSGVLTEHWTASLNASYVDSKFEGGERPCGEQGGATPVNSYATCSTDGRTSAEPNWSVSASSEYLVPLGSIDGFVRGLYKFTDNRADDGVGTNVGGYGTFDVFTGVRESDGAWEVSLWSKNLFDKEGLSSIGAQQSESLLSGGATGGYRVVTVIPERTVGVTGKYRF